MVHVGSESKVAKGKGTDEPHTGRSNAVTASSLTGWNAALWVSAVAVGCSITVQIKVLYFEDFTRPLSIELLLFLAMSLGIPTQACLSWSSGEEFRVGPWKTVLMLGMPALCDIIATALMNVGLLALSMSAVQMLRGSMAMFAAVVRIPVIGVRPKAYMWVGMGVNVIALSLVSMSSANTKATGTSLDPVIGVGLVLLSALAQALQFVAEEAVLRQGTMTPMCVMGVVTSPSSENR